MVDSVSVGLGFGFGLRSAHGLRSGIEIIGGLGSLHLDTTERLVCCRAGALLGATSYIGFLYLSMVQDLCSDFCLHLSFCALSFCALRNALSLLQHSAVYIFSAASPHG